MSFLKLILIKEKYKRTKKYPHLPQRRSLEMPWGEGGFKWKNEAKLKFQRGRGLVKIR